MLVDGGKYKFVSMAVNYKLIFVRDHERHKIQINILCRRRRDKVETRAPQKYVLPQQV